MPNIDQVQLPDGSQYNLKDNISGYVTAGYVADVIDGLTKANVGLGNVDNTSDLNKPVSTMQQTALNGKTDTTVIAPTEATTTASRRYEIGEQFILNGALYTTTAVIASGDSIIVGTNCELSESITEQIDEKAEKTDLTSIIQTGSTASQAISIGTYFYLNGTLVIAKTAIASGATLTGGTNYEAVSAGGLNQITKNILDSAQAISALNTNYPISFTEDVNDRMVAFGGFQLVGGVDPRGLGFVTRFAGAGSTAYFTCVDTVAPDSQRISGLITLTTSKAGTIKVLTGTVASAYLGISNVRIL